MEITNWNELALHIGRLFANEVYSPGDLFDLADELRYFAEKLLDKERHENEDEGKMQFFRTYAEVVTDPYEARDSFDDLEEGEDPMERAAQEFFRMSEMNMWEELTENLENATIYGN